MATTMNAPVIQPDHQRDLAAGKRRRQVREALLGVAFVLPATIVTFIFGIWPVVFGFYISLHQWRASTQNFLGLDQYVRAIGNIAYVLVLFTCLLFLYGGYRALRAGQREMAEGQGNFYLFLLPGVALSVGIMALAVGFLLQTTERTVAQGASLQVLGIIALAIGATLFWWVSQLQRRAHLE